MNFTRVLLFFLIFVSILGIVFSGFGLAQIPSTGNLGDLIQSQDDELGLDIPSYDNLWSWDLNIPDFNYQPIFECGNPNCVASSTTTTCNLSPDSSINLMQCARRNVSINITGTWDYYNYLNIIANENSQDYNITFSGDFKNSNILFDDNYSYKYLDSDDDCNLIKEPAKIMKFGKVDFRNAKNMSVSSAFNKCEARNGPTGGFHLVWKVYNELAIKEINILEDSNTLNFFIDKFDNLKINTSNPAKPKDRLISIYPGLKSHNRCLDVNVQSICTDYLDSAYNGFTSGSFPKITGQDSDNKIVSVYLYHMSKKDSNFSEDLNYNPKFSKIDVNNTNIYSTDYWNIYHNPKSRLALFNFITLNGTAADFKIKNGTLYTNGVSLDGNSKLVLENSNLREKLNPFLMVFVKYNNGPNSIIVKDFNGLAPNSKCTFNPAYFITGRSSEPFFIFENVNCGSMVDILSLSIDDVNQCLLDMTCGNFHLAPARPPSVISLAGVGPIQISPIDWQYEIGIPDLGDINFEDLFCQAHTVSEALEECGLNFRDKKLGYYSLVTVTDKYKDLLMNPGNASRSIIFGDLNATVTRPDLDVVFPNANTENNVVNVVNSNIDFMMSFISNGDFVAENNGIGLYLQNSVVKVYLDVFYLLTKAISISDSDSKIKITNNQFEKNIDAIYSNQSIIGEINTNIFSENTKNINVLPSSNIKIFIDDSNSVGIGPLAPNPYCGSSCSSGCKAEKSYVSAARFMYPYYNFDENWSTFGGFCCLGGNMYLDDLDILKDIDGDNVASVVIKGANKIDIKSDPNEYIIDSTLKRLDKAPLVFPVCSEVIGIIDGFVKLSFAGSTDYYNSLDANANIKVLISNGGPVDINITRVNYKIFSKTNNVNTVLSQGTLTYSGIINDGDVALIGTLSNVLRTYNLTTDNDYRLVVDFEYNESDYVANGGNSTSVTKTSEFDFTIFKKNKIAAPDLNGVFVLILIVVIISVFVYRKK